jgi:hypothetical protein
MIMLSMMGLYYFYYRGNSPFIKFEDQDDVEHPNLHYRAEESKVRLWLPPSLPPSLPLSLPSSSVSTEI